MAAPVAMAGLVEAATGGAALGVLALGMGPEILRDQQEILRDATFSAPEAPLVLSRREREAVFTAAQQTANHIASRRLEGTFPAGRACGGLEPPRIPALEGFPIADQRRPAPFIMAMPPLLPQAAGFPIPEQQGPNTLVMARYDGPQLNQYLSEGASSEKPERLPPRTEPRNLEEQIALEAAKRDRGEVGKPIMPYKIKDPQFVKEWDKMKYTHHSRDGKNITIHYWQNKTTGEKNGFKFKHPE